MYLPSHFSETRPEELHRLIREHPLGLFVTHTCGGLDANHLPFLPDVDRRPLGTLLAHVARANPSPWKMRDAPADYPGAQLERTVGISVELTRLEGKRKLSQNREARDFDGAVRALEDRGHLDLASAMKRSAS
ncbi:MAG TPA: FMN-binding negative transcriptional regulator [Gammaproteobacteria bacterium]|nr:FMN-binding negative transcriptional regulator [Gammaproteobacteria bacterium]